jgi:hypothetical protein
VKAKQLWRHGTLEKTMEQSKRYTLALGIYAVLAILAWTTMSSEPIDVAGGQVSFRALTLAVLGFFAARTALHWKASKIGAENKPQEREQGVS